VAVHVDEAGREREPVLIEHRLARLRPWGGDDAVARYASPWNGVPPVPS
jgi:hypothetical protein